MELQAQFAFQPDWYRVDGARAVVLDYYFALRAALRWTPHLRPCLTRCRHCRIFFLAHPRNRGRRDIYCPFGCRTAQRSKRSAERSVAYYATREGKEKKQRLNGKRRRWCAAVSEEEKSMNTEPAGGSSRGGGDPSPGAPVAMRAKPGEDPVAEEKRAGGMPVPVREVNELSPATPNQGASSGGPPDAPPGEVEAGEPAFDEDMVEHVQMVTSLLEGREVSREEVLEMLKRKWRQRSIGGDEESGYGPGKPARQEPP